MRLAQRHGLPMAHHRARQISAGEIPDWDRFVAMDVQNRADLLSLGAAPEKILLMGCFTDSGTDIPDPYGGTDEVFARVFALLQRGIPPLLTFLRNSLAPP